MSQRTRAVASVAGVVLLAALVLAGCGRRPSAPAPAASDGPVAVASSPAGEVPTAAPAGTAVAPATEGPTTPPPATEPPGSGPPPPTVAPFEAPDLTAIQRLLDDLDAALGADATANTDEGSAP